MSLIYRDDSTLYVWWFVPCGSNIVATKQGVFSCWGHIACLDGGVPIGLPFRRIIMHSFESARMHAASQYTQTGRCIGVYSRVPPHLPARMSPARVGGNIESYFVETTLRRS